MKSKRFSYGVGALVTFIISLGTAAIIYGSGIIAFDPIGLIAWVLSLLGAYTIIYALRMREDTFYYASWGLIMFAIGLASALYRVMSPLIIFGLLLIVLAIIGLIAYWRKK